MNIRQSPCHADFLKKIGWIIESNKSKSGQHFIFIRRLPLLPIAVMKIQRLKLEDLDWEWIKKLELKYNVFETLVELEGLHTIAPSPASEMLAQGFVPVADFMLTTKTRIVDLTKSTEQIKREMKPKTRYNLGLSYKKNLKVNIWNGNQVVNDDQLFDKIYELLLENARRIHMFLLPKKWIWNQINAFQQDSFIITITLPNSEELQLAACFFCSADSCFYHHNGSRSLGRVSMAPTRAIYEGILEAKKRGLTIFDFDGVYDERVPLPKWKGFTRFKCGFGGEELYFAPMYRRLRWPFLLTKA